METNSKLKHAYTILCEQTVKLSQNGAAIIVTQHAQQLQQALNSLREGIHEIEEEAKTGSEAEPLKPDLSLEEVWMRAWETGIMNPDNNCSDTDAIADNCLQSFEERFRKSKAELS